MSKPVTLFGVDFTSSPKRSKPITVARCTLVNDVVHLSTIDELFDYPSFEAFLATPGPWICGFDFPFGLPQDAVAELGWPSAWEALVQHCRVLGRADFTAASDTLRISRPKGRKYPKRAGDVFADSHSPMKCVNPPVGWMFVEGAPRLCEAGLHIPGLRQGDRNRVAIEAYPGYFARSIIGKVSYKSDKLKMLDSKRALARKRLVDGLETAAGNVPLRLSLPQRLRAELLTEPGADRLDAAICSIQAAWSYQRRHDNYGIPSDTNVVEGWIATVPAARVG